MNAAYLKRTVMLAFALLLNAACAPTQVRPVSIVPGLSGEEFALVAFSADSAEPLALRSLEILTYSESHRPRKAAEVSIYPENGAGQLFLYEFSVEAARFGIAKFEWEGEFWETEDNGPEFSIEPGTLTYLGRIQMPLAQLGRYLDSGREFPAAVRLVTTDASEDDLKRLAVYFPSTATMPLIKAIPAAWSDSERVSLRYAPVRNTRPRREGPDPLHDPPIPTEIIFEPTEIPP